MLLAHAVTLVEARSHIAALADHAHTVEASSAFERALIELDWAHGDDVPALDTFGITDDPDILTRAMRAAEACPERDITVVPD